MSEEHRERMIPQERIERILAVADELEAAGDVATNSRVYAITLGHRPDVVRTLKARRAERAAAGGVTVMDIPDEEDDEPDEETSEPTAADLRDDLQHLAAAYESWHTSLEAIWALERSGPLDLPTFTRRQWLEYQCTENLKTQEQVRAQLDAQRLREAVYAGRAQHDTLVPEAQAGAARVLDAIAALKQALAALASIFNHQVDQLTAPRDVRNNHQAFDVGTDEDLPRLWQAFFAGDPRAKTTLELLMSDVPTVGMAQDALESCPRLQPFSHTAITTYLATLTPEGSPNGRHP